jgi:hypothetical protein
MPQDNVKQMKKTLLVGNREQVVLSLSRIAVEKLRVVEEQCLSYMHAASHQPSDISPHWRRT